MFTLVSSGGLYSGYNKHVDKFSLTPKGYRFEPTKGSKLFYGLISSAYNIVKMVDRLLN